MDTISGSPPGPHDRAARLIHMHGGVDAALEVTDPETGACPSASDHEAVRAAQAGYAAEGHWLVHHGGPPARVQPLAQSEVPAGIWQASDTLHGTASILPDQRRSEVTS